MDYSVLVQLCHIGRGYCGLNGYLSLWVKQLKIIQTTTRLNGKGNKHKISLYEKRVLISLGNPISKLSLSPCHFYINNESMGMHQN